MTTLGVIGGGAWGTALAQVFAKGGRDVAIWARETEVVSSINAKNENALFLPGTPLDKKLKATGDLSEISRSDILLLVTPTQFLRATLKELQTTKPLILCCKGVELGTGLLPSEIATDAAPGAPIAVLTGPTFASEIARGLPAAVTLASNDLDFARQMQNHLAVQNFRPYASGDMTGAQLGAALKNVIAIACGIIHGRKMGESARAAIISRGLIEIARLCAAMGGKRETLMGLCGVGDLTLTCSSMQSRNFSLGAALGEGRKIDDILGERRAVTEGVYTAKAALELAARHNVELPVTAAVNACVNENLDVDSAVKALLSRPVREEL